MFKVIWSNEAGELDAVTAKTEEEAARALVKMIEEAGMIQHGDRFKVVELFDQVETGH